MLILEILSDRKTVSCSREMTVEEDLKVNRRIFDIRMAPESHLVTSRSAPSCCCFRPRPQFEVRNTSCLICRRVRRHAQCILPTNPLNQFAKHNTGLSSKTFSDHQVDVHKKGKCYISTGWMVSAYVTNETCHIENGVKISNTKTVQSEAFLSKRGGRCQVTREQSLLQGDKVNFVYEVVLGSLFGCLPVRYDLHRAREAKVT